MSISSKYLNAKSVHHHLKCGSCTIQSRRHHCKLLKTQWCKNALFSTSASCIGIFHYPVASSGFAQYFYLSSLTDTGLCWQWIPFRLGMLIEFEVVKTESPALIRLV
eukprot:NODE_888_length_3426_cov_0.568380.p2 type:complete len:107 gc:universal NODE_888_length_3426_cov_0.568380:2331-2011(-)